MRCLFILAAASAVASSACTSSTATDIDGPFTGEMHRFAVDRLSLTTVFDPTQVLGDDLDGDGTTDDAITDVLHALSGFNDAASGSAGADMIAAGAIASSVEIQADDLASSPVVGITYVGADGDAGTPMGGALVAGSLRSNRARLGGDLGSATIVVPIFLDADPSTLELELAEIDLDADGSGGFDGVVRGGIPMASATAATLAGIRQMLAADPPMHSAFARELDTNFDGVISDDEITTSNLVSGLLYPDLPQSLLSVAFAVHLSPCAAGTCVTAPPADHCDDRVRDQDETDVDCGGATCMACAPGDTCAIAADCETAACDGGTCRAATCTDGIEDGFEEAVDCGGLCPGCALDTCMVDADCQSGVCSVNDSCEQ